MTNQKPLKIDSSGDPQEFASTDTVASNNLPSVIAYINAVNNWTHDQTPAADKTYSLGVSTAAWLDIYLYYLILSDNSGSGFLQTLQTTTLTANRQCTLPNAASNPIQPLGSGTTHKWVDYIDSTGTQNLTQPTFSDISGTAKPTQLAAVFNHCRIYLVSGSPYADGSSSGNGTLYFGPCSNLGQYLTQDDGSGNLTTQAVSEASLSLTLTAGNMYDVYVSGATPTISVVIWTNATTPPTRDTDAAGRLTKHSATDHLLVGAIYASASNKTADWTGQRLVSNLYNTSLKLAACQDNTSSYTYTVASFRAANNNTTDGTDRISFCQVLAINSIGIKDIKLMSGSVNGLAMRWGVAIDSTISVTQSTWYQNVAGQLNGVCVFFDYAPQLGYHYIQRMEYGGTTATFYADNDSGVGGLSATVWN